MKITEPTIYIRLGARLRYLSGRVKGNYIIGENYIYDNLKWVKEDLNILGLKVTSNLFDRKLGKLLQSFEKLDLTEELDADENIIDASKANELINNILILEDTLFCEAKEQIIASPVPRRFSIEHLLSNPGAVLGQGVFNELTDIAQYDLEYACKCIAFECPTAAAFHILRCLEECVRVLYRAYFPRKSIEKSWGPLLTELINKPRNPKPDEILLGHLNHLRKRFRNPTNHPEKIYEIEEVEDLVHLSVDVINRVIRDDKVKP